MWFYVPPDVLVQVGDIVVIRMGHESTKTDPGAVNVATQVREKHDTTDSKCSWDPPKTFLWRRILYCTWILHLDANGRLDAYQGSTQYPVKA
jgi:hypothetical protein